MSKKVISIKRKCACGNRATNHHTLCNKCWRKRDNMKKYFLNKDKEDLGEDSP
jgi:hypothetical protein